MTKPNGIVYVHQENAWTSTELASFWVREVVLDLDVSAADVGVSDKKAVVAAICILEENPRSGRG